MSWLSRIFPDDRKLAETKYAGLESASELAARKKKTKQRVTRAIDVRDAARAGQAWEDADRRRK
ncbi:hypothetical protein [Streptomyces sp. NBC_01744]|uniref:hypothetical protein n=1 Tax=Streptomyces sp. NBC_01744 TaxID=2975927 RepID=UPI003D9A6D89|nr:hypothetical protein OIE70_36385 [Streptomyces sp. NBC_01744]